ncbi:Tetratricopeptide repeat protein [Candidatus Methanoperedenaceae archaeon GB37]|nr:Tetratricopeptide repeat protein [Candidatus Methanoperedenaceae archaeon GB37]
MAPKKKRPKKEREETTPYTTRHSKHNPPHCNQDKTILLQFHKYYSALESFERAIELKPDDAGAWFNRARLYALKGERENALADLRRAIELDSSFKERAKKDKDFEALWDDEEFKRLAA